MAVWGIGPHALKNILPAIGVCPGLSLYGVCSRNLESVSKAASQFQCKGWGDPVDMLEDKLIDIVFLSTPIGLHAIQGKAVLQAGKHLWCEKPLAMNLGQTLELERLSRERGLSLAEGFMYLYHSQFARLKQIVDVGMLGTLRCINVRFGIPPLERPGFRNNAALGGGAFLDVGSYLVSATVALLGEGRAEVLFSEISSTAESPVDTSGLAFLRYIFSTGMSVDVILEWGIDRAYRNEIDLWGDVGSVSSERFFSKAPDYVPKFRFLDRHGNESFELGRSENHFSAMFEAFIGLARDARLADQERMEIVRRAELVDKIQRAKT